MTHPAFLIIKKFYIFCTFPHFCSHHGKDRLPGSHGRRRGTAWRRRNERTSIQPEQRNTRLIDTSALVDINNRPLPGCSTASRYPDRCVLNQHQFTSTNGKLMQLSPDCNSRWSPWATIREMDGWMNRTGSQPPPRVALFSNSW